MVRRTCRSAPSPDCTAGLRSSRCFGDGHFPRKPVWVEDVALAFALAVEQPALAGAFELGGPEVLSYEEFLLAIGRATRHPRPLVHLPLALARAAAGAFDVLGAAAPLTSDQLQMLVEGSATQRMRSIRVRHPAAPVRAGVEPVSRAGRG